MTRCRALENHIRRIEKQLHDLEEKRNRFSRFRPLIFFVGVALTYWTGWTSLIVAAVVMGVEALHYNRIGKIIHRHRLWLDIKSTQLARIKLDWKNIPESPPISPDEGHPFEVDLDMSGPRSLHQLIDTAISREGSQRLRDWLLQVEPNVHSIEERRDIILELVPLSRFRDKLMLNFRLVSKEHLDGEKLLRWLQLQTPSNILQRILPFSIGLALINIVLFVCYVFKWLPGYWLLSLALYLILYFSNLPKIQHNFDTVMLLYDELEKFKIILYYLERYPYRNNSFLKKLCDTFCHQATLPSKLLKKITWLTTAVGLRMNPMLGLALNLVVPWDMFFAFLTDRYQTRCAQQFPQWVNTWSKLEALVSLANFAYLHPDYIFPEISADEPGKTQPLFQATALGHPLIPVEQKVCNDYVIQGLGEITLLTGSNMAGKSTFLKTVGLNLCLANAGGPVNALSCQTRLFQVFSCIQIHDSVTDGFSFFYAEVKRLKRILDALNSEDPLPVFFLIDEIFKGTNSRERLIGSRAYIHHLSSQRGVGIIATHDLELGQLAEQIPGLSNGHFRDAVVDGKMVFDYTLHPGLCPTTNALKLMRMEGLPIDV